MKWLLYIGIHLAAICLMVGTVNADMISPGASNSAAGGQQVGNDQPTCVSPIEWHNNIVQGNPTITVSDSHPVDSGAVATLVQAYNDPSISTPTIGSGIDGGYRIDADAADVVFGMVGNQPMTTAMVGFFKQGCYVGSLALPVDTVLAVTGGEQS